LGWDEVAFTSFGPDVLRDMPGLADYTRVLVNGVALEDLVLDDLHRSPAGWPWTGPPKDLLRRAPQHLLGQADYWTDGHYAGLPEEPGGTVFKDGRVPLLADAGCAETICAALGARITCAKDSVVWTAFAISQGGDEDPSIPLRITSFRFAVDAYQTALGIHPDAR